VFDDGLDLRAGLLSVQTAGGASYLLGCDASGRGGYLAGGGYGRQHGTPTGPRLAHDSYPIDGSVSPRLLGSVASVATLTWRTCASLAPAVRMMMAAASKPERH